MDNVNSTKSMGYYSYKPGTKISTFANTTDHIIHNITSLILTPYTTPTILPGFVLQHRSFRSYNFQYKFNGKSYPVQKHFPRPPQFSSAFHTHSHPMVRMIRCNPPILKGVILNNSKKNPEKTQVQTRHQIKYATATSQHTHNVSPFRNTYVT